MKLQEKCSVQVTPQLAVDVFTFIYYILKNIHSRSNINIKMNLIIKSIVQILLFISIIIGIKSQTLYEGDNCTVKDVQGKCTALRNCQSALDNIKRGIPPKTCSYDKFTPIVCCIASSSPPPPSAPICPVISSEYLKVKKTGSKAWDKCIDLLELILPCVNPVVMTSGAKKVRNDVCSHTVVEFIVGGESAKKNEFPHMALLGYDNKEMNSINWDCGGTLISDEWIITAAHCTWNRQTNSSVKHVRLGGGDSNTPAEPNFLYTVQNIVNNPSYKGTSVYNDLALLQLSRKVEFSAAVIPACLHTGNPVKDNKAVATGWGLTSTGGERSNNLLKVVLEKFSHEECSPRYAPNRRSPSGLLNSTQVCYGSRDISKDTCQGDSGGPLQIYNTDVYCTYTIIGVTSIGKACGIVKLPAIYTRISAFIPWIESVVWP